MEMILGLAPQLAFAAFLVFAFWQTMKHLNPYISRLLDSIDDIRETGQRMAETNAEVVKAINRGIDVFETQQEWQEQLDAVMTERFKRIMERHDALDNTLTRILFVLRECPAGKEQTYEK